MFPFSTIRQCCVSRMRYQLERGAFGLLGRKVRAYCLNAVILLSATFERCRADQRVWWRYVLSLPTQSSGRGEMYSPCAGHSLARYSESWSHLRLPAHFSLSRSVGYWEQRYSHTVQSAGATLLGGSFSMRLTDRGVVPSNKSFERTREG